jgi:hypothetical protein
MNVLDLINHAEAVCCRIGPREISRKTFVRYVRLFVSMWKKNLDPLEPHTSRDTYGQKRAALYAITAIWLIRLSNGCRHAVERGDMRSARRWARVLQRVLDRLEVAIDRDPSPPQGASPFECGPSRWRQGEGNPERGANSKRRLLLMLPREWQMRVWDSTPSDYRYRPQLALFILIPLRTEELTAGERGGVWSPGVVVESTAGNLSIIVCRAKARQGQFGSPVISFQFDPMEAGEPAKYLAELCARNGRRCVVSIDSESTFRKSIAQLGEGALPELGRQLTPIVYRHQTMANFKATFGAGGTVATAAGHVTDRSQSRYGFACHGTKRKGILAIKAATAPRVENTSRGRALRAAKHQSPADRPARNDSPD